MGLYFFIVSFAPNKALYSNNSEWFEFVDVNEIAVNDFVFWMGSKEFYAYGGTVQRLPCTVLDYVFGDFNSCFTCSFSDSITISEFTIFIT